MNIRARYYCEICKGCMGVMSRAAWEQAGRICDLCAERLEAEGRLLPSAKATAQEAR